MKTFEEIDEFIKKNIRLLDFLTSASISNECQEKAVTLLSARLLELCSVSPFLSHYAFKIQELKNWWDHATMICANDSEFITGHYYFTSDGVTHFEGVNEWATSGYGNSMFNNSGWLIHMKRLKLLNIHIKSIIESPIPESEISEMKEVLREQAKKRIEKQTEQEKKELNNLQYRANLTKRHPPFSEEHKNETYGSEVCPDCHCVNCQCGLAFNWDDENFTGDSSASSWEE